MWIASRAPFCKSRSRCVGLPSSQSPHVQKTFLRVCQLCLLVTHHFSRLPQVFHFSSVPVDFKDFSFPFVGSMGLGIRTWDVLFMKRTELSRGVANVKMWLSSIDTCGNSSLPCHSIHTVMSSPYCRLLRLPSYG